MVSDKQGGAIIAWELYDVYAQRIDSNGKQLWTTNGVVISTSASADGSHRLISDNAGGAFIVFTKWNVDSQWDIYVHRIDSNGNLMWPTNGVAICTENYYQVNPQLTKDEAGGILIIWQDKRNGDSYDLYAQRIDYNGNILWATNGIEICNAINDQEFPQLVNNSEVGVIITWQDRRTSDSYDIYAQRIDNNGNVLWAINGINICTASYDQELPQLAIDNTGGAIITWQDSRRASSYKEVDLPMIYNGL